MAALLSCRRLGTLGRLQSPGFTLAGPSLLVLRGYAAAAVATKQDRKAVTTAAAPTTKPATSTPKPARPTLQKRPATPARPTLPKKPTTPALKAATPAKVAATKPPTQGTTTKPVTKPAAHPTTTKTVKKSAAQPTTTKTVTKPVAHPTTTKTVAKPAPPPTTTKTVAKPAPLPTATENVTKPATKTVTKPAAQPIATSTPERPRLLKSRGRLDIKIAEQKKFEDLSEEEQLAQLEQAINMSKYHPTRDIWGQTIETFDLILPYSTSFSHRSNYSSWREMFEQFKTNRHNAMKNYSSMALLAWDNAIPGVDLSGHRWWHKYLMQWPWRLATTTSVAESSWLAPLRKAALDTYCQLNTALAKGDDQTLRELTSNTYQDRVLQLRKKQKRHCKYIWHFHKEVTPARVLSIRASQGYLATEPPKFGNRFIIQALVRIDTEQSLEIYTDQGVAMHNPAATRIKGGSSAEPVRVTEYFIFEKKMWYDGPWIIREQLWEVPGKKAAI